MVPEKSTSTDRFFVILGHFCSSTPVTAQKMKISKKLKKHLEISSFYTSVSKIMIISYIVSEIWHMADVMFVIFHFGLFFAVLPPPPPLTARKMKISKQKKMPGDIIILHNCTKNCDYSLYCS